ncbi:MAG TPA: cupin domain-containing protein [Thiopseudomonas sp.]|nr:cupin domain-containing protein [Thiopseudomonas sp.]
MKIAVKNIFELIPEQISEELFENIVTGENLRIERIISKGHSTADNQWYDQEEHEWVMVLKGQAKLEFADHSIVHLEAGSHINIPAHTRHRVAWTQPDTETVWLAVYYTQ